jgi:hypothetical protein
MSYQEKKIIVSVITGILVLAAYAIYAINRLQSGTASPDDLRFWATAILLFIGIGIVASIVIQIVFHILLSIAYAIREKIKNQDCDDKEIEKAIEQDMVEDEMDKLIGLKSMRIGFGVAGVGFVAALVTVALNFPAAVMLNVMFVSFSVGTIIEGFAQLRFYKKGVYNG